jgi:hypothetical protein
MVVSDLSLLLFSKIKSWEARGAAVVKLRRGRKIVQLGSEMVRVSPTSARKIIRFFEQQVCEYNRRQPIGGRIRNIRDGGEITPGRKNYYRSLRRCNLQRNYTTCREILNPQSRLVKNPRNGKSYPRESRMGKKLIRDCLN